MTQCTNSPTDATHNYDGWIGSDDAQRNSFGVVNGSGGRILQFALRLIY